MLRIGFCIFAVISALAGANAQDCIPMSVTNITLSFLGRLSWAVRADETCEITHFMVHMSEPDQDARFRFKSFTTTLNVDFLMACDLWHFNIVPHVNDVEGDGHVFVSKMPVPMDADLTIGLINVTRPEEEDYLRLQWDLNNPFFGDCSLRYRVTVSGDDDDVITDIYKDDKYVNLDFLSPCVNYEFGVRVINAAPPVMEGPLRSIEYDYPPAVQTPPTLQSVTQGATFINVTFALEPAASNRCPIRELLIDGGDYFNVTVPLHDADEREPVEVQIRYLRPNSMYLLRTSVQNSAGWSQSSIVAVQTLELTAN
ncbi:uncharacterized protein LOC108910412 [Anoplophora glabripennis]|uniref:uncharacterized protein LOC108910412 n=1 Tax=Anoplophora glabripennis TaxID=217634 RepID=UPI00087483F6|nr:uncharacterized protein LOC108910412 [Anoplophora glabripennis]